SFTPTSMTISQHPATIPTLTPNNIAITPQLTVTPSFTSNNITTSHPEPSKPKYPKEVIKDVVERIMSEELTRTFKLLASIAIQEVRVEEQRRSKFIKSLAEEIYQDLYQCLFKQ